MVQLSPPVVLIVEDERIVAKDLQQTLAELGYDAFAIASSAEEAVARASERLPDLVLMDIRIKGDLDGIETAELLRERFGTPAVYLTAHSDDATIARVKRTEPIGYLVKPIKTAELKSVIEVSLHRHHLEREHRERERWFLTTLRSIADGVVTVDRQARVTFLNPVAERLTGWGSDEAHGRDVDEVVRLLADGASVAESPARRALREGQVHDGFQAHLQSRASGRRLVTASAAPIVDDERLIGAVMVFHDISERHALEVQVEQSRRLASLGAMAAGVAHEVNNPLAAVSANLDVVRRELDDLHGGSLAPDGVGRLRELVADATEAAQRIRTIVADLGVFLRKPRSEIGAAEVARAVERAVRATAHEVAGLTRVEVGAVDVPPVALPESRLVQVLVNLLVNAAHALAGTGGGAVGIAAREVGEMVEITVRDDGPGMSEDVAERIFEPFFTTKPPGRGTGMGLFLCHGIVSASGGGLTVESAPGAGSTFRIRLPVLG
ncbi:MAG: hybrid sensor histidine kinase/response regulator [Deltaproteobacteria bacterium]|nr:MAG: hybrid sensor histidine kinase/response regulator [Deltaproteobacteria bacterium]